MNYNLFEDELEVESSDGKVCVKCKLHKPCEAYYYWENYYRSQCIECYTAMKRRVAELKRIHKYPDESYKCPICQRDHKEIVESQGKKKKAFALDHCHQTSEFRGWICGNCNLGLGCLNDSIETLQNAIDYLRGCNGKEEGQAS